MLHTTIPPANVALSWLQQTLALSYFKYSLVLAGFGLFVLVTHRPVQQMLGGQTAYDSPAWKQCLVEEHRLSGSWL